MPNSFLGSSVIWSELKYDSILDLGRVRSWTQVWLGFGSRSDFVLDSNAIESWANMWFGKVILFNACVEKKAPLPLFFFVW